MTDEVIPTDMVNHPPHYKSHPSGVEIIEITRYMGFNLGNAFKYVARAPYKDKPLEDYKKAIWYLRDFMETARERLPHVRNLWDGEQIKWSKKATELLSFEPTDSPLHDIYDLATKAYSVATIHKAIVEVECLINDL